jgi:probable metal-binding protein
MHLPMQDTHVHDIMQMMMDTGEVYTRKSLKTAIMDKFGVATTYCSCSVNMMAPDAAIDFLESRGKFIPSEEGFFTDESKKCSH